MVLEHREEYPSQCAVIETVAGKAGCAAELPRQGLLHSERDAGVRPGSTTSETGQIKRLEREVRKLR